MKRDEGKTQRGKLLGELEDYRWFVMRQLADLAEEEEEGDPWTASGWRWLADNKKWPYSKKGGGYSWWWDTSTQAEGRASCLPLEYHDVLDVTDTNRYATTPKTSVSLSRLLNKTAVHIGRALKQEAEDLKVSSVETVRKDMDFYWGTLP